jgi:hypothetical protein
MKPFRWSIAKREQLGGLVGTPAPPDLLAFVRETSARVLGAADDSDLAFIGRTPENFYDYLAGAFHEVEGAPLLHLLRFSLRWMGKAGPASLPPKAVAGLFDYFTEEGVDAASIARAQRPLALVDFVAHGGTMESLVRLLHLQAKRTRTDWNAVQRRLRIVGLRAQTHNSPNTWRWQQHQDWLQLIPDATIKNVSGNWGWVMHLANTQAKVTQSHPPHRWSGEASEMPPSDDQRAALALAVSLYDAGRSREERRALAGAIARGRDMRQPATRALALKLKR